MVKGATECDQLIIVRVVELRQLSHAVAVNILTVRHCIIFIFVALALVSRLLIFLLLIVASLVEERWVRIVQNVLRVWSYFAKRIDKSFSSLVNFGVGVVEDICLPGCSLRIIILVRTEIDLLSFIFILILISLVAKVVVMIVATFPFTRIHSIGLLVVAVRHELVHLFPALLHRFGG